MRIINLNERLCLARADGRAIDVERASAGRFGASVQAIYPRWQEFRAWADKLDEQAEASSYSDDALRAPVPAPAQIFAIGLNYRAHAAETNMGLPERPMVFTKFASSITGPHASIALPTKTVDWEVELVVVMGREARNVPESQAWEYVAGLTVGQDLSERTLQLSPPLPQQFNLGKSYPGFAPLGPALVTPDELPNPNDLKLSCSVDGEVVQEARTSDMIFSVPALITYLSSILLLSPGDIIFTGTPGGVGIMRQPPRFLRPGERLTTTIEGIGTLSNLLQG